MKITHAFLGEHGAFYAQFDHLEAVLSDEPELAAIQRCAALLASALGPHAHLENELLFDPLAEQMGGGPFHVMHGEHDHIEGLLDDIAAANDAGTARSLLTEAIRSAREHFQKEELVAFPMAEQLLDDAELRRLGDAWAARRRVQLRSS